MKEQVSITLAAVDKFSRPVESAEQSVGQLKSAVSETDKSLKALGQQSQMIGRFKGLSSQLGETKHKLTDARTELKLLQSGEVQAGQSAAEHAAAIRRAEKTVAKLSTTYGRQSKELAGLRRDMTAAGLKVNALGAEELRLAKKTKQANLALEQQAAKLKQVQKIQGRIDARNAQKGELLGQTVGLAVQAAPMLMAGKRAIDYESVFADVKKVVNFSSEEEANNYRRQMMSMAAELGVSNEGVAQIVAAAGQSGIEKDQLLQFAESATKMSVAWEVSAEDAGKTLATWRAAMGMSQEEALDLADATNFLGNNMNAKAQDIAAVLVRQGSTAMGAGFSANETAALSASLIAGGATEETAATALKNITGALTSGYAATGSQKEALDRLGFDAEELSVAMQEDAQGTLVEVLRELQDVDAADRGAIISQLFGSEVKGAVAKLVTTLDDDKNGLRKAFSRVADEADRANSVNDEYAGRAKTREYQLAKLKTSFDNLIIAVGDRLLPVVDAVVPPLISVANWLTDMVNTYPGVASGLLAVAGGIAVLKAGAIAWKAAKLFGGNAVDKVRLGKAQLGMDKLSRSTGQTSQSANLASRSLDRLNRKLAGLGRGSAAGGYGREGRGRTRRGRTRGRGRFGRLAGGIGDLLGGFAPEPAMAGATPTTRRRPRMGGKFGRMAGLLGGGAALTMFSGAANAGDMALAGADMAGASAGLAGLLPSAGMLGKVGKVGGKLFRPLDVALQGAALTSAIADGDAKSIGGTAGDMVGGLGGAAAGAMAGAAIGSVVPIVGTAVGGIIGSVIGGFGGGELGGWLGEKVGGWFSEDKTEQPAPAEVAKKAEQLQQVNKQITFSPTIQVTPSGDPAYDQRVANDLMARMEAELSPVLMGNTDMDTRADASLSDRSDT